MGGGDPLAGADEHDGAGKGQSDTKPASLPVVSPVMVASVMVASVVIASVVIASVVIASISFRTAAVISTIRVCGVLAAVVAVPSLGRAVAGSRVIVVLGVVGGGVAIRRLIRAAFHQVARGNIRGRVPRSRVLPVLSMLCVMVGTGCPSSRRRRR